MLGEGVLNVGANTQNVGNLWKSHLFNTPHMDIKWVERLMGWNRLCMSVCVCMCVYVCVCVCVCVYLCF